MKSGLHLSTLHERADILSAVPLRYITDARDFIAHGLALHRPALVGVRRAIEAGDHEKAWSALFAWFRARPAVIDDRAVALPLSDAAVVRLTREADDRLAAWRDANGRVDWNCGNEPARTDWERYWSRNGLAFLLRWAQAANASGEPRLEQAVVEVFLEWYDDCPVPAFGHEAYWDRPRHGFSWREIEVGVRGRMLQALFSATLAWDNVPDRFHRCLLMSIKQHLDYLSSYTVAFGFILGNHQTNHAPAMFAGSFLFPELEGAALWRRLGRYIYQDHLKTDHDRDCIQNEYSPSYHFEVMELYLDAYRLLKSNGRPIPAWLSRALNKMIEYGRYSTTPGGFWVEINDTRSGSTAARVDRLATYLGRPELSMTNMSLRPVSRAFKGGGLALMRSGWSADDALVVLDATGHNSGHWHPGKPNLLIYGGGTPLACEHIYGTYDDPSFTGYFHTARAHNTVMVDGLGDNEPATPWEYRYKTRHGLDAFVTGADADIARASTDGFCRLDAPVAFERTVVFIKPDTVIVHDNMRTSGEHGYEWLLHLLPQTPVVDPESHVLVTSHDFPWRLTCAPAEELLSAIEGPFIEQGCTRNEVGPIADAARTYWNAPAAGDAPALLAPAPYAVWRTRRDGDTALTFLLRIHRRDGAPDGPALERIPLVDRTMAVYRLGRRIVYFDDRRAARKSPLTVDGVCLRGRAGVAHTGGDAMPVVLT